MQRLRNLNDLQAESAQFLTPQRLARFGAPGPAGRSQLVGYASNVAVASSFYPLLHIAEVLLRNSLDRYIKSVSGWSVAHAPFRSWILESRNLLQPQAQRSVDEAMEKIKYRRDPVTGLWILEANSPARSHDDLIAALSFGFWTGLVTKRYNFSQPRVVYLWPAGIAQIFPHTQYKKIEPISNVLRELRHFRNRVFHHERVLHYNLLQVRKQLLDLTAWISPAIYRTTKHADQTPHVIDSAFDRITEAMILNSCGHA